MSVLKFNRHKLFTIEDNRKVMDLNRKIEDHNWENGKKGFCVLSNNLAGMFDGFLYLNTPALAAKYPDEIRDEVQELFNKIVMHIVKVGETETEIFQLKEKTMIRRNESEGGWALLENGYIHTSELNKEDAEEMLERYVRIFDNMEWSIVFIDN